MPPFLCLAVWGLSSSEWPATVPSPLRVSCPKVLRKFPELCLTILSQPRLSVHLTGLEGAGVSAVQTTGPECGEGCCLR